MEKQRKLNLIQRSLGLRHKLKVHESMRQPDTHEELARTFLAQWELEDELRAIESILTDARQANMAEKKARLLEHGFVKPPKKDLYSPEEDSLPLSDLDDLAEAADTRPRSGGKGEGSKKPGASPRKSRK